MDDATRKAVQALVRLHQTTEACLSDPQTPGIEQLLAGSAAEAQQALHEAGLLDAPGETITALVRELYPGLRPHSDDGRPLAAHLVPIGPGQREIVLRGVLVSRVGMLGSWDDRMVAELAATLDWAQLAAVTAWIERAGRRAR
ncbi:hypothetical protein [Kitasatospora mediocidica]|uniref:hypothetical protein n=1 Tax=Kitasatospora mediocidica TaxID=58352 RepID=UPI00055E42A1|nr:hypothetical protein [Kitasatospora mediocidica]